MSAPAYPEDHQLAAASHFGVPVVPQGARSGLSGAANAIDGCIVVSTEKMDRVLEIDASNRLVVTQPGVLDADPSRQDPPPSWTSSRPGSVFAIHGVTT